MLAVNTRQQGAFNTYCNNYNIEYMYKWCHNKYNCCYNTVIKHRSDKGKKFYRNSQWTCWYIWQIWWTGSTYRSSVLTEWRMNLYDASRVWRLHSSTTEDSIVSVESLIQDDLQSEPDGCRTWFSKVEGSWNRSWEVVMLESIVSYNLK